MSRITTTALLLLSAALGQTDALVAVVDGDPGERVETEGRAERLVATDRVKHGKAALKVSPDAAARFYGATFKSIPTNGAPTLICVAFLEGDREVDFRIRLDDAGSGRTQDESAIDYRAFKPGWNEVVIPLLSRTTKEGRSLDFTKTVEALQISRRRDDGAPAIVFDALLLRGGAEKPGPASKPSAESPSPIAADDPTPEQRALEKKLRFSCASEKDGAARARLVREGVDALGEALRIEFCARLLKEDQAPRVRRAAREGLSRTNTESGTRRLLAAIAELPEAERVEAAWALGASASPVVRAAAIARATAPETPFPERASLLFGLAKKGTDDVASIAAACPPEGPWPQRAALVRALREGETIACVDALIDVLEKPGSERVADDAEEALVELLDRDFGRNARAWRDYWVVARDKSPTLGKGVRKSGYGSFYGLAIPKSRVAFVIDTSGSMRDPVSGDRVAEHMKTAKHLDPASIKTRLDLAKAELKNAIDGLDEAAFAAIVAFSDDRTFLTDGLERATAPLKEKLQKRVKNLAAAGKTNVYAGMHAAFFPSKTPTPKDFVDGPDTIVLLSDGAPSAGVHSRRDDLRDEVLAWNLGRAVKIHCVNVGDADARLLGAWTRASGGKLLDLRSTRPPAAR